jgi:hypothetical protein
VDLDLDLVLDDRKADPSEAMGFTEPGAIRIGPRLTQALELP